MEHDIDSVRQPVHQRLVADVALNHAYVARRLGRSEVRAAPAREVIEHDDLRPLVDQPVRDVRPDEAEPAGDQRALHHHSPSVAARRAATMRSTCALDSSGNIGRESTRAALRSASGKAPLR
jgi:hypothetical protein